MTSNTNPGTRYLEPDAMTRRVANPVISGLAKVGIGVRGACNLQVRGRKSGEIRTVPVNPLPFGDDRFLVAPRGETQWVRNIRASGEADLRKGRTVETIRVTEVPDVDKAPIIRAYLEIWAKDVSKFFEGLTKDSSDAEIAVVAHGFPVFRIAAR